MRVLERPKAAPPMRPAVVASYRRWYDYLWVPGLTALVTLLVGLIGYAAQAVWLFPSLGPTVALQILSPHRESSRPYHVITGHMCGLAAGFAGVFAVGSQNVAPAVGGAPMLLPHVWAATIAMALTVLFQKLLAAQHAPGFATTLLIALGAFPADTQTAATVIVGVCLVVAFGEPARSAALRRAAKRAIETPPPPPLERPSGLDRR